MARFVYCFRYMKLNKIYDIDQKITYYKQKKLNYFAKFYNHLPLVSARPFPTSLMFDLRSRYNLFNI